MYTQTFSKLTLCQLTPEQHARTCNYWYVVQNHHGPHTAFTTAEELETWLENLGLELTAPLVERGQHSYQEIKGQYSRASHMSYDEFYNLPAILEVKQHDNGRLTQMFITEAEDGTRTLHHLNPNCKHRIEYHYRTGAPMPANEYDKMVMSGNY